MKTSGFLKRTRALARKCKPVLFGLYWFLFPIIAVILLCLKHLNLAIGAFSAVFLIQKQKLEETRLFKELFMEFTSRYDRLNDKITDIKAEESPCQKQQIQKTLDDYFNLCAEEYLFYEEGRILDSVWAAWCRGMKEHLKAKPIGDYWQRAQRENSYYGLTTEVIEKGAGPDLEGTENTES